MAPSKARWHQLEWVASSVLIFALLFTGLFIPRGPKANAQQLAELRGGDIAWMLSATTLVLFMTPGLAFFYGGMVRHHSVISTMLQCTICLGLIGVLWVVMGFSLAFGEDAGGFIGNPWTYFWFRNVGTAPNPDFAPTIPFCLYAMFQLKFAIITPALTAGGYIERIRFAPFLWYLVFYLFIIYCPVAHWVWHPQGFLHVWGVRDFAGGSVVHMTSGYSALAGAIVVGRREAVRRGEEIHPSSVPFIILGTGMLWFGWFGFNAGSQLAADEVAAQAFLNTNTASASAMLMFLALEGAAGKKPSAVGACIGAVVGLVVITPAAGYVDVGQSLFFGGFGAIFCTTAIWLMRQTGIDDGLDAFATHGVGGTLGCILTGAFLDPVSPAYGDWSVFGYYWASITIVGVWAFGWSMIIWYTLSLFTRLRLSPAEEDYGLDETQHGESMYKGCPLSSSLVTAAPASPRIGGSMDSTQAQAEDLVALHIIANGDPPSHDKAPPEPIKSPRLPDDKAEGGTPAASPKVQPRDL